LAHQDAGPHGEAVGRHAAELIDSVGDSQCGDGHGSVQGDKLEKHDGDQGPEQHVDSAGQADGKQFLVDRPIQVKKALDTDGKGSPTALQVPEPGKKGKQVGDAGGSSRPEHTPSQPFQGCERYGAEHEKRIEDHVQYSGGQQEQHGCLCIPGAPQNGVDSVGREENRDKY